MFPSSLVFETNLSILSIFERIIKLTCNMQGCASTHSPGKSFESEMLSSRKQFDAQHQNQDQDHNYLGLDGSILVFY